MNKSFLGAVIMGITAVLFFVFFMPSYNAYVHAREVRQERIKLLKEVTATQANILKLSAEYETNKDSIQRILLALPERRQVDYITSSLESAVTMAGMQLSAISIGQAQRAENTNYQTIPVSVKLVGTYTQFLDFTGKLEKSLRLYDITKIDLASSGVDSTANTLSINFELQAYSLK